MTKKIILLLLIFPFALSTFGTELEGTYKNENDSICFSDGKLTFSLSGYSALSTNIVGEGKYIVNDKYLIIDTYEYSGVKSSIKSSSKESKDSISIYIAGYDGYNLPGVLVEFLSSSNKSIDHAISDDTGIINKPFNEKVENVKISLMGYNGLSFKYDTSLDYRIVLAKNKVLENQTILFEIEIDDEDSIKLTLLSENFNAGRDIDKSLEKAYKKAKKTNSLGKRFKKEYVSVFYNR